MKEYKSIYVRDNDFIKALEEYDKQGYKFVSFYYDSGAYGLFKTYVLLVKEN